MFRRTLIQRFSTGDIEAIEAPPPVPSAHTVIVRNVASLVSAGTERMLAEFGRANVVGKARQQPERVAEVMSKVRTDGLLPTVEAVRSKLDSPTTLGTPRRAWSSASDRHRVAIPAGRHGRAKSW